MITSSITSVNTRTVNSIDDTYLKCGQSVLVRKFNDSLFPSGSWNEVWIGFRWRITTAWNWNRVNSNGFPNDFTRFLAGVCRTDGFVFGQTGSVSSSAQPQHYAAVGFSAQNQFGENTWSMQQTQSIGSSITESYIQNRFTIRVMVTGSHSSSQLDGTGFVEKIPVTPYPQGSRNMFIVRMRTGSVVPDLWTFQCLAPQTADSISDVSSSVYLASTMNFSTWEAAAGFLISRGYASSSVNSLPLSRSSNGYFDGAFISWPRYYETLDVSDFVMKFI